MRVLLLILCLLSPAAMAAPGDEPGTMCASGEWSHVQCIRPSHFVHDTCQAIDRYAEDFGLDKGFFARLIWQESRFDPNALSPADAMGIAQFIASTAKLRGLQDPYNPAEALEHSAEYLSEMQTRYGSPGMAAVGYNGGEGRAQRFIAEQGGLARETINYVRIITGLTAETWRDAPPEAHDFRLQGDMPFEEACHAMAKTRRFTRLEPPTPSFRRWGVQIGFGTSRSSAKDKVARQTRSCRGLVGRETIDFVPVRNRLPNRAPYVMARIGRDSMGEASRLCNRLRAQGCLCAVFKNP